MGATVACRTVRNFSWRAVIEWLRLLQDTNGQFRSNKKRNKKRSRCVQPRNLDWDTNAWKQREQHGCCFWTVQLCDLFGRVGNRASRVCGPFGPAVTPLSAGSIISWRPRSTHTPYFFRTRDGSLSTNPVHREKKKDPARASPACEPHRASPRSRQGSPSLVPRGHSERSARHGWSFLAGSYAMLPAGRKGSVQKKILSAHVWLLSTLFFTLHQQEEQLAAWTTKLLASSHARTVARMCKILGTHMWDSECLPQRPPPCQYAFPTDEMRWRDAPCAGVPANVESQNSPPRQPHSTLNPLPTVPSNPYEFNNFFLKKKKTTHKSFSHVSPSPVPPSSPPPPGSPTSEPFWERTDCPRTRQQGQDPTTVNVWHGWSYVLPACGSSEQHIKFVFCVCRDEERLCGSTFCSAAAQMEKWKQWKRENGKMKQMKKWQNGQIGKNEKMKKWK